jgi:hypothetical protein
LLSDNVFTGLAPRAKDHVPERFTIFFWLVALYTTPVDFPHTAHCNILVFRRHSHVFGRSGKFPK